MKKSLLALSAAAFCAAVCAQSVPTAQAKTPEPNWSLSYNMGVVSDYRYRGISQSRLEPALQGGADWAHKNGFYVGTWASTIKWIKDAGAIANVDSGSNFLEVDIYGGHKGELSKDVTYDVGLLQYWYPGNDYSNIPGAANANTLEVYGALSSGPLTLKYSYALTDLFGAADKVAGTSSKGSGYFDVSTSFELGKGLTLVPHVGRQVVQNFPQFSYTDYSLTLNKEFDGGWVGSAGLVTTSTRTDISSPYPYVTPDGKNLGKDAVVLGLRKNF